MTLFIFNDASGRQRADFYESQISDDVIWQGDSWEELLETTGFTKANIGGLYIEAGLLRYSKALRDAHNAHITLEKTAKEKLIELTSLMSGLPIPLQASFLPVSSTVATALNANNVELAIFVVDSIETKDDVSLQQLKESILDILKS